MHELLLKKTECRNKEEEPPFIAKTGDLPITSHLVGVLIIIWHLRGESYVKIEEKLRKEVRAMLQQDDHKVVVDFDPLHLLELIDTLQRLGLSYHLRIKTKELWLGYTIRILIITAIINKNKKVLLRQHGYDIPAKETFSCFKDEKRSFKLSCLGDDCKGILALSEAAYLLVEGESNIFLDAINSTTTYLKE
ncbi:hypothetical protein CUMW_265560 [Citrus unshiu]|uniref:Terpene synthase N-terminal domain-containing protein n=1 Tax=Citrus unshiu TaxID=55188 RepID=A0A2H5QVH5_CITUN|nr:hypothetical protein CUMW_265560 [Citrus unshiu]